jgi:predicted permease
MTNRAALLREWLVRLAGTLRPRRSDEDLEAELRSHLEMEAERALHQGATAGTARRTAVLRVGAVSQAMEAARDRRGLRWLADLSRDAIYGSRALLRDPAFSVVAILSLALGIGANTAIFSLVETVTLRALPVAQPQELVFIEAVGSEGGGGAPPYPCFERFRRETTAFAGMAAFATDQLNVNVDGSVEEVFGQVASGNYFQLLGVRPAIGRLIIEADERLDPPVAVIGYGYWQRRFGGAPDVLGRTLAFHDRAYTIVGVTPRDFWGLEPGRQVEVTLPITLEREHLADAGDWWFNAVARVRQGAALDEATTQVDTVFQSFMRGSNLSGLRAKFFDRLELRPAAHGRNGLRSRFSRPLYGLTIVAALVLLIACANIGSLLLVRGAARGREFAIRLATGAGSARLFRQLLTETGLLFLCGAAAGIPIALTAVDALTGFFTVGRNPIRLDVQLNWRVGLFAAAVVGVAAAATALWPALRALQTGPQDALKDGANRLAGSRRTGRATRVLVAAQVAIALVLLVTAVIFARTMINLRAVDLGFDGTHVLTLSLDPVLPDDSAAQVRPQLWRQMLARVQALPGVRAASLSVLTPLSGRDSSRVVTTTGVQPRDEADRIIHVNHVSEDYFRTFGIQLVRGRTFSNTDQATAPRVVVLGEAAARWLFAGRDPVGQTIRLGAAQSYQVIGVVRDARHRSVREAAARFAFIPLWQQDSGISRTTLAVSSSLPSSLLVRTIGDTVRAVHASTLISEVIGVEDQIDATLVSERLLSTLAAGFGLLALGLAAIGVYGVLSYSVSQRRAEFGIRSALGASPASLAWTVLREVALEVVFGAAIGLPLAAGGARLSRSLLYGVQPGDPGQYLICATLLAVVVTLAAMWPVRRAWLIDPAETLRRG